MCTPKCVPLAVLDTPDVCANQKFTQQVFIKEIYEHPLYTVDEGNGQLSYDVALIKTKKAMGKYWQRGSKPFFLTPSVRNVCLPRARFINNAFIG